MSQFPPFNRERAPGAASSAPGQSEGCSQPMPQGQGTPSLGSPRAAGCIPQAMLHSSQGSPRAGLPQAFSLGRQKICIVQFILFLFRAGSLLLGKKEEIGALQTPLAGLAGSSLWIKLAELGCSEPGQDHKGSFCENRVPAQHPRSPSGTPAPQRRPDWAAPGGPLGSPRPAAGGTRSTRGDAHARGVPTHRSTHPARAGRARWCHSSARASVSPRSKRRGWRGSRRRIPPRPPSAPLLGSPPRPAWARERAEQPPTDTPAQTEPPAQGASPTPKKNQNQKNPINAHFGRSARSGGSPSPPNPRGTRTPGTPRVGSPPGPAHRGRAGGAGAGCAPPPAAQPPASTPTPAHSPASRRRSWGCRWHPALMGPPSDRPRPAPARPGPAPPPPPSPGPAGMRGGRRARRGPPSPGGGGGPRAPHTPKSSPATSGLGFAATNPAQKSDPSPPTAPKPSQPPWLVLGMGSKGGEVGVPQPCPPGGVGEGMQACPSGRMLSMG